MFRVSDYHYIRDANIVSLIMLRIILFEKRTSKKTKIIKTMQMVMLIPNQTRVECAKRQSIYNRITCGTNRNNDNSKKRE